MILVLGLTRKRRKGSSVIDLYMKFDEDENDFRCCHYCLAYNDVVLVKWALKAHLTCGGPKYHFKENNVVTRWKNPNIIWTLYFGSDFIASC